MKQRLNLRLIVERLLRQFDDFTPKGTGSEQKVRVSSLCAICKRLHRWYNYIGQMVVNAIVEFKAGYP